jgi:hypothetical protein
MFGAKIIPNSKESCQYQRIKVAAPLQIPLLVTVPLSTTKVLAHLCCRDLYRSTRCSLKAEICPFSPIFPKSEQFHLNLCFKFAFYRCAILLDNCASKNVSNQNLINSHQLILQTLMIKGSWSSFKGAQHISWCAIPTMSLNLKCSDLKSVGETCWI